MHRLELGLGGLGGDPEDSFDPYTLKSPPHRVDDGSSIFNSDDETDTLLSNKWKQPSGMPFAGMPLAEMQPAGMPLAEMQLSGMEPAGMPPASRLMFPMPLQRTDREPAPDTKRGAASAPEAQQGTESAPGSMASLTSEFAQRPEASQNNGSAQSSQPQPSPLLPPPGPASHEIKVSAQNIIHKIKDLVDMVQNPARNMFQMSGHLGVLKALHAPSDMIMGIAAMPMHLMMNTPKALQGLAHVIFFLIEHLPAEYKYLQDAVTGLKKYLKPNDKHYSEVHRIIENSKPTNNTVLLLLAQFNRQVGVSKTAFTFDPRWKIVIYFIEDLLSKPRLVKTSKATKRGKPPNFSSSNPRKSKKAKTEGEGTQPPEPASESSPSLEDPEFEPYSGFNTAVITSLLPARDKSQRIRGRTGGAKQRQTPTPADAPGAPQNATSSTPMMGLPLQLPPQESLQTLPQDSSHSASSMPVQKPAQPEQAPAQTAQLLPSMPLVQRNWDTASLMEVQAAAVGEGKPQAMLQAPAGQPVGNAATSFGLFSLIRSASQIPGTAQQPQNFPDTMVPDSHIQEMFLAQLHIVLEKENLVEILQFLTSPFARLVTSWSRDKWELPRQLVQHYLPGQLPQHFLPNQAAVNNGSSSSAPPAMPGMQMRRS